MAMLLLGGERVRVNGKSMTVSYCWEENGQALAVVLAGVAISRKFFRYYLTRKIGMQGFENDDKIGKFLAEKTFFDEFTGVNLATFVSRGQHFRGEGRVRVWPGQDTQPKAHVLSNIFVEQVLSLGDPVIVCGGASGPQAGIVFKAADDFMFYFNRMNHFSFFVKINGDFTGDDLGAPVLLDIGPTDEFPLVGFVAACEGDLLYISTMTPRVFTTMFTRNF
jgi:hypothetical protein